ncbi:tRNA (uracil-5-)-methyltransferase homolog A-like [Limulus polyphemus]|uniref:tRNA (uracil(54)-C(5))-methyltransferase n=1 Tax=Limulus polyphemus TaxID=6850 RepID=A0ABM1BKM4_LIMPO|nr:tRNA (uracil-5-)-methyltransferase homolog A-like [Limulus polyphemus]
MEESPKAAVICEIKDKSNEEKLMGSNSELQAVENVDKEQTVGNTKETSSSYEGNVQNDSASSQYRYIQCGFTSEVYKIEVGNLPQFVHYGQLKKELTAKLKLKPHKIKILGNNAKFAFVTFRCEEDREEALKKLQGHSFKKRELKVKKANPIADPLVKKRKLHENNDRIKKKQLKEEEPNIPVALRLKNVVTPLWEKDYQEQLKLKESNLHGVLVKLGRKIEKINPSLLPWLQEQREQNDFKCCPLLPIRESPVTTGYRNKCEFTVGRHVESSEVTVGFRLSSYKDGCMFIGEPDQCMNISKPMLQVVKVFQKYVQNSDKEPYNPETYEGFWRQLTVRNSSKGDILLIVVMHPQSLTQEQLNHEKQQLKSYFVSGPGQSCGVTSLYFLLYSKKQGSGSEPPPEHLWGKTYIEESILNINFQIGPEAFFQVNTKAAEVLYSTVAEFANLTPTTTILDICCGTGTIGLSLAKKVKKVIGLECSAEAIGNACMNAQINDIHNVDFICGKAEDMIHEVIEKAESSNIVAIVDPPRAGLQIKVIKTIRATTQIHHLVYVSCSPETALTNFVDLCRPASNNYRGDCFVPVVAIPVDLFPHTPHCELVIVFERKSCNT